MAHELDRNTRTGRLAYFGVKRSAWHGEGFTLDTPPTYDKALELAGADYDVVLKSLRVVMSPNDVVDSPMGKATVRTDRNQVLGIVGDDYRPIQNRDAFEVLRPLIDNGVASIETGGTLRNGADAWMLVRFTIDDPIVREVFTDEVIPFALIATNHSGRRKVVCMETPIRVVCANTLSCAFKTHGAAVAVSHRGDNGSARMVDAAQNLFKGVVGRYRAIAEAYSSLKSRILTVDEFAKSVLDVAVPMPTDPQAPRFQSACNRALDRRNAITGLWTHGAGHTGDLSAWEAYNGLVQAVDHEPDVFRVRGSRVSSLMDGSLHAVKDDVLASLVAVSR